MRSSGYLLPRSLETNIHTPDLLAVTHLILYEHNLHVLGRMQWTQEMGQLLGVGVAFQLGFRTM